MNNLFVKLHGGSKGPGQEQVVITTKQFLSKDGVEGYTTASEFLTYARSLRPKEVSDLENILLLMASRLRVDNLTNIRTDRGGRLYIFPRFHKPQSDPGGKLILEAGMSKFINDYAEGSISISFTLAELIEEALNQ